MMPLTADMMFEKGDEQSGGEKSEHDYEQNYPEDTLQEYYQDNESFIDGQKHINDEDQDMLTRPRTKKLVPDLPQKSHLRASRILDNLAIDLAETKVEDQVSLYSNLHDSYLSSEEDESASGDDYEDVVSDFEESDDKSTPTRRHSYEETARAISFTYVKPQLVEINHSHHSSPVFIDQRRRLSLSSSRSQPVLTTLPPRNNSKRPSLAISTLLPLSTTEAPQHSFLSRDPYPAESLLAMHSPSNISPRNSALSLQTVKPEKSSSGWGGLRAMSSRTLALARKKASMPKLNMAYNAGAAPKRTFTFPIQSEGASASSISISSADANAPPAPAMRRRSQTIDRLVGISSREERPSSEYVVRRDHGPEDWRSIIKSPTSTTSSVKSSEFQVETLRSSIPDMHAPTRVAPTYQQRNRSYTTSQASASSTSVNSRSRDQDATLAPFTPTSSTQSQEEITKMRRMTVFPDYNRATQIARQRDDQKRESSMSANTHDGTMMMNSSPAPVGNTYNDIMKSVSIVANESGNGREKERGLKGRAGISILAGVGAGLRRAGKGVRAG